jgi:hypothetical protein
MRNVAIAPGARFDPYEIGAARDMPEFGEVYDAHDADQQRDVAFRVLRADFAADPDRLQRFEQEAYAAAKLAHPNILTVHDVGTDTEAAYVVTEPIDGRTLRELLELGALPVATVAQYAAAIASGLAAAHGNGIIHRDLRPENILVTPGGGAKIIGLGLAAVTQHASMLAHGVPLGTLSYMSPEQLRGATVDQRSDMFTFGTIVHEMLSGERAFGRGAPIDTMTAVLESDPPPLPVADVPPALARVVALSLKKDPESRLSADDVVTALQNLGSPPEPAAAVPMPAAPTTVRSRGRVAAVLGALAVAVVVGVWLVRGAGTGGTLTPAPPSPTPSQSMPAQSAVSPPETAFPVTTPPAPAAPPVDAGPRLVWFDREGTELGGVGAPGDYGDVSLSPDGLHVAVSVREPGSEAADIWVLDVGSGVRTRVTSDSADDIAPVWSADGQRILFASSRTGSYDIYERASSDAGGDTVLVEAAGDQIAYDRSSDGGYLVYQTDQPGDLGGGNLDLWARRLPGGRPFAFLRTVHAASRATFSPDGGRVVYGSLEGGRDDVYVARFPNYDGRRRVSAGGGSWSRWSRDGSEIFYLDPDNQMMVAPVDAGSSELGAGAPRALFQARVRPDRGYAYDVSADGQRFLVSVAGDDAGAAVGDTPN